MKISEMNPITWHERKGEAYAALGSEIPWTHPGCRKRGKDQKDVKNVRDLPQGREVIQMNWHLKNHICSGSLRPGKM